MCIDSNTALAQNSREVSPVPRLMWDLGLYILSKTLGTRVDHFSRGWTPNALKIQVQSAELWEPSAGLDIRGERAVPELPLLPPAASSPWAGRTTAGSTGKKEKQHFISALFYFFPPKETLASSEGKLSKTALSRTLVWNHTNRRHPFTSPQKCFPQETKSIILSK